MARKLLILASAKDQLSRAFVQQYAASGVCLVTPEDLSVVGWRHRLGENHACTAAVAGQRLAPCDIAGVVTRIHGVFAPELDYIIAKDRNYVATEMTAFLRFWLTELPCLVLNRPTPNCLSGPYWSHEKWVQTAARLDIPIVPIHRRVVLSEALSTMDRVAPNSCIVTLVGEQHFGDVHPVLVEQARALAAVAGVQLLAVHFSGPEPGAHFVHANLWPNIVAEDVASAILEYVEAHAITHG